MKHAAIGLVVGLLVFALLMGICSARGFDLARIDQWPWLAAFASVCSGYFGGVAEFISWRHET